MTDKDSFLALYDRAGRRLMGHLVRRLHDVDAAAELWAECWAVAFENWSRCNAADGAAAEAWLFGIARNLLSSYFRSGSIRRRALERLRWTVPAVDSSWQDELERVAERDLLTTILADAVRELPAKRRDAVQLRIVGGLSYAEVATRMGCSERAARAHVSRALRRPRRCWTPMNSQPDLDPHDDHPR